MFFPQLWGGPTRPKIEKLWNLQTTHVLILFSRKHQDVSLIGGLNIVSEENGLYSLGEDFGEAPSRSIKQHLPLVSTSFSTLAPQSRRIKQSRPFRSLSFLNTHQSPHMAV